MGKGVLYKYNATTGSKSQSKKANATTLSDGRVMHTDATNIYDNYPMEQEHTENFTATWSQGWRGDGVRLDEGVWKSNILVGSTTNYMGMYGFNRNAIQSFIADGKVTKLRLRVNCYQTTTNGSPDVRIGKHTYASEPSGTWNGSTNTSYYDYVDLHVPNQALGGYWVTMNPSQMYFNGVLCGGVALKGVTATDENHGKFNAWNTFDTLLQITVLK